MLDDAQSKSIRVEGWVCWFDRLWQDDVCDLLVGRGVESFLVVMFVRCLMFDSIGRGSRFVG